MAENVMSHRVAGAPAQRPVPSRYPSSKQLSAGQKAQQWFNRLNYESYIGAERVGQRQRWQRSLSAQEWRQLYGTRYMYSSDFIHSHPKHFTAPIAGMARLANRTEEWAELTFRFTGCFARFLGSLSLRSLRETSGTPRINRDLRRRLRARGFKFPEMQFGLEQRDVSQSPILFCAALVNILRRKGVLNLRGSLTAELTEALLLDCVNDPELGLKNQWQRGDPRLKALVAELNRVSRTRKVGNTSLAGKILTITGCVASTLAFTAISIGTSSIGGGMQVTFLAKMGMLASSLYLTAFLLRSATTLAARMGASHRGRLGPQSTGGNNYRSLFDMSSQFLRNKRIDLYRYLSGNPDWTFHSAGALTADEREAEDRLARQQASFLKHDESLPSALRGLFRFSSMLNRGTDFLFSLDRVTAQTVVSRPLKEGLFRYHGRLEHVHGLSANKKASVDWLFRRANASRAGRFRQALASFVGHGGADALGMFIGCGACSAAWTSLNIAAGGSLGLVGTVGEASATLGIGFASMCALGWSGAVATEGVARGAHAGWKAVKAKTDGNPYQELHG